MPSDPHRCYSAAPTGCVDDTGCAAAGRCEFAPTPQTTVASVTPCQGEHVEMSSGEYTDYIRYAPDHWMVRMGESWEPCYGDERLEPDMTQPPDDARAWESMPPAGREFGAPGATIRTYRAEVRHTAGGTSAIFIYAGTFAEAAAWLATWPEAVEAHITEAQQVESNV